MRPALLLCAALVCAVAASGESPILDPGQRAARDALRLGEARATSTVSTQARTEAAARRARLGRALESAREQASALAAANDALARTEKALGEDLSLVDAIARSTLQAQNRRLQIGPVGLDYPQLVEDTKETLREPPGLDMLYRAWFALHTEWLAGGEASATVRPVTRRDGERRDAEVTRYGAVALAREDRLLVRDANAGLLESAPQHERLRIGREFFAQQVYDSGVIGVAVLACALLGLGVAARQLRRSATRAEDVQPARQRRQTLKIIATAAMLLGLLGTVVGLIHTFRALAHFGGSDASIAAAGISHALSTTWMGLTVAISLMLLQGIMNMLPLRAGTAGAIDLPKRAGKPASGWAWPRIALSLTGATLLSGILFFFMQWLTQRPLAEPVAATSPLRIARIDWEQPPPPPRETTPNVNPSASVPGVSARQLPALAPLPAPSAEVALPELSFDGQLAGLSTGGGALSGAGELWTGATSGDALPDGVDLVPISSARPRYPRSALDAGVEGWVEAIFVIDADGSVRDVRIIDADPPGVFEQAAATALLKWLYAPFYRDGKPVAREATQLLRFSLDDASETYVRDED